MGFFEIFARVLAFFYSVVPSYGLAIILLTLTTRVLLLPLSIKSTRSMREMQVIQPEIKKLQKKYKGDRQKLNTEMMALYKEHGVNPFGGCMPLLLQMPVFIALYRVIRNSVSYLVGSGTALLVALQADPVGVHHFLGIRLDCSATLALSGKASEIVTQVGSDGKILNTVTETCGSGGILSALPYLSLILLMGASTYYQQRQMTAARAGTTTDPNAQQMQTFMKVMPFFLVVIGIGFPAGVVIYWLTTNAWTIVQQRIMLKAAPPVRASDKSGSSAKSLGKGGNSKSAAGKSGNSKSAAGKTGTSKSSSVKGDGQAAKKSTAKNSSSKPAAKSPAGKTTSSSSPNSKKKKKR